MAQRQVLSQLHHLECQLNAIENTARTVQGELLASNQVKVYSTCTCMCAHTCHRVFQYIFCTIFHCYVSQHFIIAHAHVYIVH